MIYRFELPTGNSGVLTVSDELLDTESRAEERALSEFLKNSYSHNNIVFHTYRTDLKLNNVINVKGLPYLVKSLTTTIGAAKLVVTVGAKRYD